MTFAAGSSFGAAAALVPFGMIISPKWGLGTSYDANGNIQFTTPGGTLVTPDRVDNLLLVGITDPLLALADDTDDGSAADTGVLTTAAPIAGNAHHLPANFGIGRGAWTNAVNSGLPSFLHFEVSFATANNTVAAVTNAGGPYVRTLAQAAGDVTVAIKNMSEVTLNFSTIVVRLRHSIIG